jgi:hypothetical protein
VVGATFRLSAVPVNLSFGARELLGRAGDVSAELVCLVVLRARLDDPSCLAWLDLAKAPALSGWLAAEGVREGAERSAVRARLREAVEVLIDWPRDLGVFTDRVARRSWLVASAPEVGADEGSSVGFELDLVAESGLADRAVSVVEVEVVLGSMGVSVPARSVDLGLGDVWEVEDDAVAWGEGWGLFWTARDPVLEVQCLDAPGPGEGVLADDEAAWRCVLDGLLRGSPTHARAFGSLLVHAPSEAVAMVEYWADQVADPRLDRGRGRELGSGSPQRTGRGVVRGSGRSAGLGR